MRDRLSRPDDISAMFARRRQSIGGIAILLDEPEEVGSGTPFRWGATAMTGTRGAMGSAATRGGGVGRVSLGTPRTRNRRGGSQSLYRSPVVVGRENTPLGRVRTPLRNITAVVRAIERRRASLRETESLQNESPIPQVQNVLDPSVPTSGAQLEHNISMISPNPTVGMRRSFRPSVGKVSKILLDITNQNVGQPDCLTPQKFLNSIDTVEKVVMEELKKLKSTPGAKKAEWEKKSVVLGGGQDASAVTTTDHCSGKFEAKLCQLVKTVESMLTIKGPQGRINRAVWGPLNKTIVTAGEDAVIRIWNSETGKLLKESDKETGHKKTITSLTKSADSSHLLTGSLDKSAKVVLGGGQDASAVTTTDHCAGKFEARFFGKVLQEEIGGVKRRFGPINALAFNPDGKRY
ncbi:unnamed protein product [Camellia sinensis]